MNRTNLTRVLCVGVAILLLALAVIPVIVRADESILSLGKPYTVEYESSIDHAFPAYKYASESRLTDGKLASGMSYSDQAFLELYRGTAVSVTVDLEAVSAVSAVELRTMQSKAAGVYCARYVIVSVSENGIDYATVGSLEDKKTVTDTSKKMVTHRVDLDKVYLARYVKITFSCDVYTYTDEVSVFGSTDTNGAISAKPDSIAEDIGYADEIDGIGNIVLMYTVGNYTEDTLLPYLAYLDESGNVADTMFDSMLFLPSPASGYDFSKPATWDSYIDTMFGAAKKSNLTALNKLVGDYREELSLAADYRYPVFLAIPYLDIGNNSFDGVKPNSLENRTKIISAYIDKMIELFDQSNFDHLELKGFYWFHESIAYSSSDYEEAFMVAFNDYVHKQGLKSIWIPYYCAPGFERAAELGFDAATLQSGYAFPRSGDSLKLLGEILPGSVDDSAKQARKYGLGMEFELDINATNAYERFYKYLHTGYSTGCMDGNMMMLYQAVDGIYKCSKSPQSSDQRKIYDLLYLYNKGNFTSAAPVIEPDQIIVADINARASMTLAITDNDSLKSKLYIAEITATEGLTYVLEGDGFFLVNTKNTDPGVYTLKFKVSDGYNLSDEALFKVLVADYEHPSSTETLDVDLPLYQNMTTSAEVAVLSSGTVVNRYDAENGWSYIKATVDGKEFCGFAMLSASELEESSAPNGTTETNPMNWLIVVAVAVVACAIVGVIIILAKKQKNKG